MTDPDEQPLDFSDSTDDYATVEEVAAELARLSESALDKIELQASTRRSGGP
jgi:hypothetical protein